MSEGGEFYVRLSDAVRRLYGLVGELEEIAPGRHFTLDGHLVGSLGEAYAKERYGLVLYTAGEPVHDGEDKRGRKVQIKCTQSTRIVLGARDEDRADYLIALKLYPDGRFEELYNGKGSRVWDEVSGHKPQKTSQTKISIIRLRELAKLVYPEERIGEP